MKRQGELFKLLLFKTLSFENYLFVLSKFFFLTYNLGLLKKLPLYKYHYFLKSVIKKNDVIIDIGANLGYYALNFSRWAGKSGVVYAVEPVEAARNVLSKNARNYKNIKIIPYALGEHNQDITIINTSRSCKGFIASGSNFVMENPKALSNENIDKFNAIMRKGSELFSGLARIDFIKCDVEGYEPNIIPEMESLLIKHQPVMLIETRRKKRSMILDYLNTLGFTGYVLENGHLHLATSLKEKEEDDILFIPNSKLEVYKQFLA